jgi:hypothetical protein
MSTNIDIILDKMDDILKGSDYSFRRHYYTPNFPIKTNIATSNIWKKWVASLQQQKQIKQTFESTESQIIELRNYLQSHSIKL